MTRQSASSATSKVTVLADRTLKSTGVKKINALTAVLAAIRETHENQIAGNLNDEDVSIQMAGLLDAAELIVNEMAGL